MQNSTAFIWQPNATWFAGWIKTSRLHNDWRDNQAQPTGCIQAQVRWSNGNQNSFPIPADNDKTPEVFCRFFNPKSHRIIMSAGNQDSLIYRIIQIKKKPPAWENNAEGFQSLDLTWWCKYISILKRKCVDNWTKHFFIMDNPQPIIGRRQCWQCQREIQYRNKVSFAFSIRRKRKVLCNVCSGSRLKPRHHKTSACPSVVTV